MYRQMQEEIAKLTEQIAEQAGQRCGARLLLTHPGVGPVPFGTDVRSFQLAAELNHNGSDRVYTVTYKATDASGNTTLASAQVEVGTGGSNGAAKPPRNSKGKRKGKDEDKNRKGDHDHN